MTRITEITRIPPTSRIPRPLDQAVPSVFVGLQHLDAAVEFVIQAGILERYGTEIGDELEECHLILAEAVGLR